MINVVIDGKIVDVVKNWDSALRVCAGFYKNGSELETMKIINSSGEELPVQIKHLIISC